MPLRILAGVLISTVLLLPCSAADFVGLGARWETLYGEASAVEYFGQELGLPPAISAHNNWFLWGLGACSGEVLLVIGDDAETLGKLFADVELGATFDCRDCMPYEDNLPVWIVRRPRGDLAGLWSRIKHFD